MKKIVALVLVMVMAFSFSAVALAAGSPTIKPVEVKEATPEAAKALEAAVYEQLGSKVGDKEVAEKALVFDFSGKGDTAVKVAGVKKGDKVFVLFYDKDGKLQVLDAIVGEDGVVQFKAVGEGTYMVAKVVPEDQANKANLIPKTGDSNRLMKLVVVGLAAIAVMTLAGVAIKRSNNI